MSNPLRLIQTIVLRPIEYQPIIRFQYSWFCDWFRCVKNASPSSSNNRTKVNSERNGLLSFSIGGCILLHSSIRSLLVVEMILRTLTVLADMLTFYIVGEYVIGDCERVRSVVARDFCQWRSGNGDFHCHTSDGPEITIGRLRSEASQPGDPR